LDWWKIRILDQGAKEEIGGFKFEAQIGSRPEPSPMAIIGAILAQGAIRFLDRQKREQRAAEKSIRPAEPLQN
jgi:hypothetical protein